MKTKQNCRWNFIKRNVVSAIFLAVLLLLGNQFSSAQGFQNLDFENATIVNDPQGGFPWSIYANDAIPGWTAYSNGVPQKDIWYNAIPLGFPGVTLLDNNNGPGFPLISGQYFIMICGQVTHGTGTGNAAIGQTGQIPPSAQSLTFWGNLGGLQATFNDQQLTFISIGSTADYTIYAADVSAYAGQTGQLIFTSPVNSNALLDNIQFSSSSIPEPNTLALGAIGALLFGFRRWRKLFIRR